MTTTQNNAWLLEDDPDGADAELTTEFVKGAVRTHLDINIQPGDKEGRAKLDGMVDVESMTRLAAMRDKSDRAMVYHASNVVHKSSQRYSPGEAETISEWLAEALDDTLVSSSEYYDLDFVAGQLVPYMVDNGLANAAVLWAMGYKRKTRTAVPMLRHLFKQAPRNLPDRVKEVVGWVVDPDKTKKDIEKAWRKEKGIKPVPLAFGTEEIIANNLTKITITCNPAQLGAIKKRLKGLVDFDNEEAT